MTDFTHHAHDIAHSIVSELAVMENYLDPADVTGILYVGCCCGYEAGLFAKYYPDAQVHAIEAVQETYDNFLGDSRSCCDSRVVTACAVMDEVARPATLHLSQANTCHSLLELNACKDGQREIQTTTIADYCEAADLHPQILALDVEGVPLRVLKGAGAVLDGVQMVMAETEIHANRVFRGNDTDEQVDEFLAVRGFRRLLGAHPPGLGRPSDFTQLNSLWKRVDLSTRFKYDKIGYGGECD